jgi:hypothetical protein
MIKKTVGSIALIAALILIVQSALAQNYKGKPKPTIQDYGPFKEEQVMKFRNTVTRAASGTCGNPAGDCLFYGGDFLFDPFYPSVANALANENTTLVGASPYGAAVWVPFTVPSGQTWEVTGLFTNNLSDYGVLDQAPTEPTASAFWSVNEGAQAGIAGTVVASGTSAATITPTGRSAFSMIEFTVQVEGLSFVLTPGTYWMTVVPQCTNTADPYCFETFFVSDVEYINTTPKNAFGPPEPIDSAFFDSSYFGITFDPANGPLGACAGLGCDAFSAGVLGKEVTK